MDSERVNWCSTQGKYDEQRASECCRQLASALHHLHSKGVTHRDLKVMCMLQPVIMHQPLLHRS